MKKLSIFTGKNIDPNPSTAMRKLGFPIVLLVFAIPFQGFNQRIDAGYVPAFIAPDTVCQGYEVVITNTSPGTSFYWNFCTGNASYIPYGVNIGDPGGHLRAPYYIHTVKDSNLFYSFVSSAQNGELIRYFHGNSLTGYMDSITNLGRFGILDFNIRGMCAAKDGDSWYVFVADGSTILRLDFGTSLLNDPAPAAFTFSQLFLPEKVLIIQEGAEWIGFVTDSQTSRLSRLRFGNSLANAPQLEGVGSFLPLSGPCGFDLRQGNGNWYMLVSNVSLNSISRLDFGNSLLNEPTGEYLPGLGDLSSNIDVSITQDCERTNAYVTNCVKEDIFLVHLQFNHGLAGSATASPVFGNPAILNKPYGLSAIFRVQDTLYMLVVNNGSSMISRMAFPECGESSIPTWNGPDPPPIVYDSPGNYNIILRIDEGTPNEQVFCHNIVVMPVPDFNLGPNRFICRGDTAWLDPGAGYTSYLWSTGDTSQILPVADSGTFWVEVVNTWDCIGRDTVAIGVHDTYLDAVDTTICRGLVYWAQGGWQSESGVYFDTLMTVHHCDSVLQTNLFVEICPLRFWIPTAFSPNGDGLNDTFHPVAQNILQYRMVIFDRWGQQLYESTSLDDSWDGTYKGKQCPSGIYSYIVYFQTYDNIGQNEKRTGTVMLIK